MNRTFRATLVLTAVLVVGPSVGPAGAIDVTVNIGAPTIIAPPIVTAPPSIVIVPGTPVYTVPSANYNVFVYRDRYYSFHHDTWFVTIGAGTPWQVIAVEHVPHYVRAVPVAYYRIPPGHGKEHEKKWKDHDRDDDRDNDHRDRKSSEGRKQQGRH